VGGKWTFSVSDGSTYAADSGSATVLTILSDKQSNFEGPVGFKSYAVASLPSAATAGQMIFISDETGGAVMAFSDGTNWRRVTDRAVAA